MEYVGIIAGAFGLILTSVNIVSYFKKDGAREGATESDLQVVRQGNASILVKLDKMDSKMDNINERLIRVEESTKSAHRRIDGLEGRQ